MECKLSIFNQPTNHPNEPGKIIQIYRFSGNLGQFGVKFDYFRFVIEYEYIQPKDRENVGFNFEIHELHLNDACFSNTQCLHDGECVSKGYGQEYKEGFSCSCKEPYEDKSKCKDKDYCKYKVSFI